MITFFEGCILFVFCFNVLELGYKIYNNKDKIKKYLYNK